MIGEELKNFQDKNEDLKFLFIDEYSMIGCRLLTAIYIRLRQMTDKNLPFGGLVMYFFGDCKQLLPVGDTPLFSNVSGKSSANGLLERGKLLVESIHKCFFLRTSHRFGDLSYTS